MRLLLIVLALIGILPTVCAFAADAKDSAAKGKELNHVVLIKFKEGASEDQIKKVEQAFAALKEKVPGVLSLKWGTNVSPENKNKGFTHAFVLTFGSDKDRDGYLVHPAHRDFGKVLGPVVGDVLVIDFWSHE